MNVTQDNFSISAGFERRDAGSWVIKTRSSGTAFISTLAHVHIYTHMCNRRCLGHGPNATCEAKTSARSGTSGLLPLPGLLDSGSNLNHG